MQPAAFLTVRGCFSDPKASACGDAYTSFRAAHPNDRDKLPVEKRAAKVPEPYLAAACDLDQKFHKSKRGEVGPIKARLLEFCTRGELKPHASGGFCRSTHSRSASRRFYASGVLRRKAAGLALFLAAFATWYCPPAIQGMSGGTLVVRMCAEKQFWDTGSCHAGDLNRSFFHAGLVIWA
jgi:hypothetical protein